MDEEVKELLEFADDPFRVEQYITDLNTKANIIIVPQRLEDKSREKLLLFKLQTNLTDYKNTFNRLGKCSCNHNKSHHTEKVCMCGHRKKFHGAEKGVRGWGECPVEGCDCKVYRYNKSKNRGCTDCKCLNYKLVLSKKENRTREKCLKNIEKIKKQLQ